MRLLYCAILIAACASSLAAATKSEDLYTEYEAFNTEKNLGVVFAGGKPPVFVEKQLALLKKLAAEPAKESQPVALRIADEYLRRVEALGDAKFRTSPLQPLQLSILALLEHYLGGDEAIARIEAFGKSRVIKDYARGRALGVVAARKAGAIPQAQDPDGKRRAAVLMEILVGDEGLPVMLHRPVWLAELAQVSAKVSSDAVLAHTALWAGATRDAQKYAADSVFANAIATNRAVKKVQVPPEEKSVLLDVAVRWVKEYKPVVDKEKFATDVVGRDLLATAGSGACEELSAFLALSGIKVPPATVPPANTVPPTVPPVGVQPKPKPTPGK